ncbi:acyltransferase [Vibrio cortegadensis]|uniref:DapH/DapD/GlmU-related protein n=1 Tax=Vibrio cortegadensis TaxID=1328770 RepID=A0ABV4M6Z8_9VIBR
MKLVVYARNIIKTMIYKIIYINRFKLKISKVNSNSDILISKSGTLSLEGKASMRGGFINVNGGNLYIKNGFFMNRGCSINCQNRIYIGEDVIIGENVLFYDHNHRITNGIVDKNIFDLGEIRIGNNVWIGSNSIILKDVTIGDNCVISAGSVVSKDVPAQTVLIQKKQNYYG